MFKYKSVDPEETISRVLDILHKFGFSIQKLQEYQIGPHIFSCSVSIDNNPSLTTNGKGESKSYALASALGEMMERLQSFMIFWGKLGDLDETAYFSAFPDAIFLKSKDELLNINKENCEYVRQLVEQNGFQFSKYPYVVAPFYSVEKDKLVYLPLSYILKAAGSNGLCAGNTPSEALCEGLCELFERASLHEIFKDNRELTIIPRSAITSTSVNAAIKLLEESGFSIKLFDCSFGMGFPTVAVLLYSEKDNFAKFSIGTHLVLNYAISRTITECFQGYSFDQFQKLNLVKKNIEEIENNHLSIWHKKWSKSQVYTVNYYRNTINGTGSVPEIFWNELSESNMSSWKLEEAINSHDEMLAFLLQVTKKNNLDLFVYDNSFMGFCAYRLFLSNYTGYAKLEWDKETFSQRMTSLAIDYECDDIYRLMKQSLARKDMTNKEMSLILEYINALMELPLPPGLNRDKWLDLIARAEISADLIIYPELIGMLFAYRLNYVSLCKLYLLSLMKRIEGINSNGKRTMMEQSIEAVSLGLNNYATGESLTYDGVQPFFEEAVREVRRTISICPVANNSVETFVKMKDIALKNPIEQLRLQKLLESL